MSATAERRMGCPLSEPEIGLIIKVARRFVIASQAKYFLVKRCSGDGAQGSGLHHRTPQIRREQQCERRQF
jgi:hypothetical protein